MDYIQVSLAAEGPVEVEKPATQSVEIPNGREKTVYFTVKTGGASGNVRFTVTAAGNGERSRSTTNVGVRPDLPEITVEDAAATIDVLVRFVDALAAMQQAGHVS